jgi:hypothetical protein
VPEGPCERQCKPGRREQDGRRQRAASQSHEREKEEGGSRKDQAHTGDDIRREGFPIASRGVGQN